MITSSPFGERGGAVLGVVVVGLRAADSPDSEQDGGGKQDGGMAHGSPQGQSAHRRHHPAACAPRGGGVPEL
ncbi:hypothetical protein [Streptomyces sp. NPDC005805]|uniref:hypothetical protein n=1 Tax=Streptomyces sp. NPDC005805 TaxID=3157068 RepID=UPI0033C378BF